MTSTRAGRDRAGGGHQHREEPRHAVGGDQHGLVAGDVRLRGERVHRLGARDPRHGLHRERDDALAAQALDALRVGERGRGIRSGPFPAPSPRPRPRVGRATRTIVSAPSSRLPPRAASRPPRRSPRRGSRQPLRRRARRRSRTRPRPAGRRFRARGRPGPRRRQPHGERQSRIPGIYGKGFGAVGGTSPNVTRLSIFTAAMSVCDPSLEGHASRVGVHAEAVARRLGWTDDRARGSAARRRAPRCRQGERPPRRSQQAGPARRRRARRGARPSGRGRLADRRRPVARGRAAVRAVPPRALGRRLATRRAAPGSRSRSRAGCSPSPTRSTR